MDTSIINLVLTMSDKLLNTKYFSQIETKSNDNATYQTYVPRYSTMFLVSTISEEPLAAVSLKCSDGCPGKTVIAPRLNATHANFQGLINRDDQEFEFIITNLVSDSMIKIDIMKDNTMVNCVDPGSVLGGLNQVNELRGLESYSVQVDQQTGSTMVLSTIKTDLNKKITVGDAEVINPHKPLGTYYHIAVTPRKDSKQIVKKFQSTKWVSLPMFCIRNILDNRFKISTNDQILGFGFDNDDDDDDNLNGDIDLLLDPSTYREYESKVSPESIPADYISKNSGPKKSCAKSQQSIPKGSSSKKSCAKSQSNVKGSNSERSTERCLVNDDLIASSFASDVKQGTKKTVYTRSTGIDYEYNVSSNQTGKLCTISLSVSKNLKFYKPLSKYEIQLESSKLITDYMTNNHQTLVDQIDVVYIETECVICLEAGPNTILYECGHSCLHSECIGNIDKCPLCRRHITAVLNCS